MKRIFILSLLLLCFGCTDKEIKKVEDALSNSITNMYQETPYVDDNPITVGLYYQGKLVKDFYGQYKDDHDLATFNIVYTNDKDLGGTNVKKNWNKYYSKYKNIDDYKIGFLMEFEANGKKLENLILDPSAKYKTSPYIYIYLYDGVHKRDGAWYTHLDMKDIRENTVYSSIKLYMCEQTKKITSPITLTVFTYKDENDFDTNHHYRGKSKYTITIYNK